MQTTTMLTLIIAALVLALIGLAVYTRHTAGSARANGYDQGYDDAKLANAQRIDELNHTIEHQSHQAKVERREHNQSLEAIMQDCDERIAIYAARSLTAEDILTLRIVNSQLLLAVQTYTNLKLLDQARFANTAVQRFGQVIARIAEALPAVPKQPDDILDVAANSVPNGKSWLVHGPQACGKTRNARAIADALGLPDILDDWQPGMPVPTTKTLVLTNAEGPFQPFTRRVLSFEQAMSLVASKQGAAA